MTEENQNQQQGNQQGQQQGENQQQGNQQPDQVDLATLPEPVRKYIEGLRQESAKYRTQLHAQTQAEKQREQEALKAQGQWEQVAKKLQADVEGLTVKATRADDYEKLITTSNQKRVEQIPETQRSLVPTELEPIMLSQWLDKNWSLLQPRKAPDLNPGAGGQGGGKLPELSQEEITMAKLMGMTPEKYAAAKVQQSTNKTF